MIVMVVGKSLTRGKISGGVAVLGMAWKSQGLRGVS